MEVILLGLGCVGSSLWIAFQLGRERLKTYLFDSIDEYIDGYIADLDKNPQKIKKIAEIAMKALDIKPPGGGSNGDIKFGGVKVPGWIAQLIMSRFLPQAAETAAQANPFG